MRQRLDDAATPLGSASYTPFGVPQTSTPDPFGFTGELHSQDLVYLRARWYDPSSGVFMGRDPIGELGGLNLYAYASNNPINRVDAWGLADYALANNATSLEAHNLKTFGELMKSFPLAPQAGTHPQYTREEAIEWEKVVWGVVGASATRIPNASRHMSMYLTARKAEDVRETDFHGLASSDPNFVETFLIPEVKEALQLVLSKHTSQEDGIYYVYSKTSTGFDEASKYGVQRGEGSRDWYYAIGRYQVWGSGKVEASCDYGGSYTVDLNLHLFDRYDWEGDKINIVPLIETEVPDAKMAALHHYGLAKYYYIREKSPVTISITYARLGDGDDGLYPILWELNTTPNLPFSAQDIQAISFP